MSPHKTARDESCGKYFFFVRISKLKTITKIKKLNKEDQQYYTPPSRDSDRTKSKMLFGITRFCDFDNRLILSHHDDIITSTKGQPVHVDMLKCVTYHYILGTH